MTNYKKFAAAVIAFVGEVLSTKELEVLANEQGLKLANLFPAACSVTTFPIPEGKTVNDFRAPSSANYPVLFQLQGRGNYKVLAEENQYWPAGKGRGSRGQTLADAEATIKQLREKLAAREQEQATV